MRKGYKSRIQVERGYPRLRGSGRSSNPKMNFLPYKDASLPAGPGFSWMMRKGNG